VFKEIVDLFSLQKMRDNLINKCKGYNKEEKNKLNIPVQWIRQRKTAFDIKVRHSGCSFHQTALITYL